jgi:hypothetical protein
MLMLVVDRLKNMVPILIGRGLAGPQERSAESYVEIFYR